VPGLPDLRNKSKLCFDSSVCIILYIAGNPSLPGTVVCGVCGAVRFYRFVKQARKFGIFSCESCRKFVSKMMKRQACSKGGKLPVLECHKGAGEETVVL
jgi:histone-lysine N-methyltransferase MLL1